MYLTEQKIFSQSPLPWPLLLTQITLWWTGSHQESYNSFWNKLVFSIAWCPWNPTQWGTFWGRGSKKIIIFFLKKVLLIIWVGFKGMWPSLKKKKIKIFLLTLPQKIPHSALLSNFQTLSLPLPLLHLTQWLAIFKHFTMFFAAMFCSGFCSFCVLFCFYVAGVSSTIDPPGEILMVLQNSSSASSSLAVSPGQSLYISVSVSFSS